MANIVFLVRVRCHLHSFSVDRVSNFVQRNLFMLLSWKDTLGSIQGPKDKISHTKPMLNLDSCSFTQSKLDRKEFHLISRLL